MLGAAPLVDVGESQVAPAAPSRARRRPVAGIGRRAGAGVVARGRRRAPGQRAPLTRRPLGRHGGHATRPARLSQGTAGMMMAMEPTSLRFARLARSLAEAARPRACARPRSAPAADPRRVPVDRAAGGRRHGGGGRPAGRPWPAVVADMVEGVVAANRLAGARADRVRSACGPPWARRRAARREGVGVGCDREVDPGVGGAHVGRTTTTSPGCPTPTCSWWCGTASRRARPQRLGGQPPHQRPPPPRARRARPDPEAADGSHLRAGRCCASATARATCSGATAGSRGTSSRRSRHHLARVAELADAEGLNLSGRKAVRVRLHPGHA